MKNNKGQWLKINGLKKKPEKSMDQIKNNNK